MSRTTVELHGKETVSEAAHKAANASKSLGQATGGLIRNFTDLTAAGMVVIGAVKKVGDIVMDVTREWAEQERAVITFNAAMKQTGKINEDGARSLREFADAMGELTGADDEAILQMESFLATSGRTEAEIKKLITAAADMSVATGDDLASAVEKLNATYSGTAGKLEKIVPELDGLTKAELENGGAVDIIAKKYAGLSEELSNSSDVTLKNFKNAWDDLKASMGAAAAPIFQPIVKWLGEVAKGWADSAAAARDYRDAQAKAKAGIALSGDETRIKIEGDLEAVRKRLADTPTHLANPEALAPLLAQERALAQALSTLNATPVLASQKAGNAPGAQGNGDVLTLKENYKQLADFLVKMQADERRADYYGENLDAKKKRLDDYNFNFDELTRNLDLGPEGTKLKEQIKEIIIGGMREANRPSNDPDVGIETSYSDGVYRPPVEAPKPDFLTTLDSSMGGTAGAMSMLGDSMGGVTAQIIPLVAQFGEMGLAVFAVQQVAAGIGEELGPLMDSLLQPLVGILVLLGKSIAAQLKPALEVLQPIIVGVAQLFTWLFNNIFRHFYNASITLFNAWYNAWAGVYNFISTLIRGISFGAWDIGSADYRSLDQGHVGEIGMSDVYGASKANPAYGAQSGGNASYSKPRDITINNYVYTPAMVGEGGFRDFCLMVGRVIKDAGVLGMA